MFSFLLFLLLFMCFFFIFIVYQFCFFPFFLSFVFFAPLLAVQAHLVGKENGASPDWMIVEQLLVVTKVFCVRSADLGEIVFVHFRR